MGVQKRYNGMNWELIGWGFRWTFPTETECDANRKKAWDLHKANLDAFKVVADMLCGYRG